MHFLMENITSQMISVVLSTNTLERKRSLELMHYVDDLNVKFGGGETKMYSTAGTKFKKLCLQNKLNLLDASVRHLGTDINYIVLENIYQELKDKVEFRFFYPVSRLETVRRWISCVPRRRI